MYGSYLACNDDDNITRDDLVVIGNPFDWLSDYNKAIKHGGNFPTALYYNPKTNTFYQKAWDLNDYGEDAQGNGGSTVTDGWGKFKNIGKLKAGNVLDKIGNPMVITTGYSKIADYDAYSKATANLCLENFLKEQGLVPIDKNNRQPFGIKKSVSELKGKNFNVNDYDFYDVHGKSYAVEDDSEIEDIFNGDDSVKDVYYVNNNDTTFNYGHPDIVVSFDKKNLDRPTEVSTEVLGKKYSYKPKKRTLAGKE